MTWGSCGKKIGSWRLVEVVKEVVLEILQKVFVVGLGKKINPTCHENLQDGMALRNSVFNQI